MIAARRVLVVAAHADDETLGAGGTIARWTAEGRQVALAFLTDGVGARGHDDEAVSVRQAAAVAASQLLGVCDVRFGDLPDNQLDQVPMLRLAQHVEALVEEFVPELVLTHHLGDLNVDHRCAAEAVATACRPQPSYPVRSIWSFEVASSTEWQLPAARTSFVPNVFVDIGGHWERKCAALMAYQDEMREWPHARSIQALEALARWRGASVGVEAAEAFVVQRMLL